MTPSWCRSARVNSCAKGGEMFACPTEPVIRVQLSDHYGQSRPPEWQAVYGTLRNGVEGMNGFVKDGARGALDDPERRWIRGVAPQSLFVAFLLFSANLRKIDSILAGQEAEGHCCVD